MSDPYLTRDELQELTGAVARKGVLRAIQASGWPHFIGADGWPRILRAYHDARLTGQRPPGDEPIDGDAEPQWSRPCSIRASARG